MERKKQMILKKCAKDRVGAINFGPNNVFDKKLRNVAYIDFSLRGQFLSFCDFKVVGYKIMEAKTIEKTIGPSRPLYFSLEPK